MAGRNICNRRCNQCSPCVSGGLITKGFLSSFFLASPTIAPSSKYVIAWNSKSSSDSSSSPIGITEFESFDEILGAVFVDAEPFLEKLKLRAVEGGEGGGEAVVACWVIVDAAVAGVEDVSFEPSSGRWDISSDVALLENYGLLFIERNKGRNP